MELKRLRGSPGPSTLPDKGDNLPSAIPPHHEPTVDEHQKGQPAENGGSSSVSSSMPNNIPPPAQPVPGREQVPVSEPEPESESSGAQTASASRFRRRPPKHTTIVADACAIAASLPFVAFGVILQSSGAEEIQLRAPWSTGDINPRSLLTISILQIAGAFPYVYAAVMGRLLMQIARWKLDRGVDLLTLEQLAGSRTLAGAVLTYFNLPATRKSRLLTAMLLVAWSFSPLGQQSLLNALSRTTADISTSVVYNRTDAPAYFENISNTTKNAGWWQKVSYLYVAALATSNKVIQSKSDPWGRVKVPILSTYGDRNSLDWQNSPSNATYASLFGVDIELWWWAVWTSESIDFNIDTSYIELDCQQASAVEVPRAGGSQSMQPLDETGLGRRGVGGSHPAPHNAVENGTWQGYDLVRGVKPEPWNYGKTNATWSLAINRLIWYGWPSMGGHLDPYKEPDLSQAATAPAFFENMTGVEAGETKIMLQIPKLMYGANEIQQGSNTTIITTTCTVYQRYIESAVSCILEEVFRASTKSYVLSTCAIKKQRPSQKQHASENISHLSFPEVFRYLSWGLPQATGLVPTGPVMTEVDPSISYLAYGFDSKWDYSYLHPGLVYGDLLHNTTARNISIRLSQLLNTYLHLGQGFRTPGVPGVRLNVSATRHLPIGYARSAAWSAVFSTSSAIMLAAAILGIIIGHKCNSPDLLGSASSVVRYSKYIDVGLGRSQLDGTELTSALGSLRLRFGILAAGDERKDPSVLDGTALVGVGLEIETQRLE